MDNSPEYYKKKALENLKKYKEFKHKNPEKANTAAQHAAYYGQRYRESLFTAEKRSSPPVSEKGIPNLFRKAAASKLPTAAPATAFQPVERMTLSAPEDRMTLSAPEDPFSRITRNPSDETLEEEYAELKRLVDKERLDEERLDEESLDEESLHELMEELRLQEEKEKEKNKTKKQEEQEEQILQRQSEREREEMLRRREEEYKGRTGKLLNPLTSDEDYSSFQPVSPAIDPSIAAPSVRTTIDPSIAAPSVRTTIVPPGSTPPIPAQIRPSPPSPSSGPPSSVTPPVVTQSVVVPAAAGPSSVIPPGATPSIPAQIRPFLGPSAPKPITNKTRKASKKPAVDNMGTELKQLPPKLTRRMNRLGFSESLKNPPNKAKLKANPKANPNICHNIFMNGLNVNKKFFYPSQFPNLTRIKPIMVTMKKNDNSDKKGGKRKSRKLRKIRKK